MVEYNAAAAVAVAVAAERHSDLLHTQIEPKEDKVQAPMRVEVVVAQAGLEKGSYMFFVVDLALDTNTEMHE